MCVRPAEAISIRESRKATHGTLRERKTQSLLVPLFSFRDIPHSLDGYVYIDYTVIVCSLHFYFFSYIQDPAIIIVQSLATDKEGPENVTKKRKKESKKL